MKRNLWRALRIVCLLVAVAVCVGLLQENLFCHADHNRQRLKGFYLEDSDSLDVVYIGASEVYSDIAPGYAYDRDGITGYLFASQANTILNYKSQLKNILSRQKNALIVIELNGAMYEDEDLTKEANLHNYGDNIPLDLTKLEWVAQNVRENRLEFLFPFVKYHSNWSREKDEDEKYRTTIQNDAARGYNYLKGVLNWTVAFKSPLPTLNSTLTSYADKREPITETAEKSLRDLLEYCRKEELHNVVFARFPHIVTESSLDRFAKSNTVGDIVSEYGFDYLNFERDFAATGLDEDRDFYNFDHLNIYGQQKFTAFLTDYLKEHYSLSPHTLSETQQAEWKTCADYYKAYVSYSENMMQNLKFRELSEDHELIDALKEYLPKDQAS